MTKTLNLQHRTLNPPKALELTPKGFTAGDPQGRTDSTPFTLEMVDDMGKEYTVKFIVRNFYLGQMNQALKRLVPTKRMH